MEIDWEAIDLELRKYYSGGLVRRMVFRAKGELIGGTSFVIPRGHLEGVFFRFMCLCIVEKKKILIDGSRKLCYVFTPQYLTKCKKK